MYQEKMPDEFMPKVWMNWAKSIGFGCFGLFAIVMGPLFATGLMKNARDEPAHEAGYWMIGVGVIAVLPAFLVNISRLRASRGFLLKICREGLVYRSFGKSRLNRVPFVPGLIRCWRLILSGACFKTSFIAIRWETIQSVAVTGLPGARTLTIIAGCQPDRMTAVASAADGGVRLVLRDAEFRHPLNQIADSITFYQRHHVNESANLRSWFDIHGFRID